MGGEERDSPACLPIAWYERVSLEHSETEERWFSIGCAGNGAMLSVVYLWSDADPEPTKIRLISARTATQTEIRHYQEGL